MVSYARAWLTLAIASAAVLAACSSGTTVVTPPPPFVPTAGPTPTAVPIPQASAFAVVQQQAVTLPSAGAAASPVPVALPSAAGFAPTLQLPPPSAATNAVVTASVQNTAPSSVPALDRKRAALAIRGLLTANNAVPILFLGLYWNATLDLPATPGFTFALPPAYLITGTAYYLALYDPTRPSLGWNYAFEGPGAVGNGGVVFSGGAAPFTFVGGLGYWLALLAIPQSGPQPTPAPSVTPTSVPTQSPPPTPTPAPAGISVVIPIPTPAPVVCSPAPVTVAVGRTVTIFCTSATYGGIFTTSVSPSGIASVQQSNPRNPAYFDITGVAPGSATLSLHYPPSGAGSVGITVTP